MAFPDLTPARVVLERMMVDTCRITRDPPGYHDDIWDPITGTYVRPDGDDLTVYEGKCKFGPMQNRADIPREQGGAPELTRQYQATLPWDAPAVKPGDVFEVLTSERDPQAPGTRFVIINQIKNTMLTARRLTLEEVTDAFPGVRGA